MFKHSRLFATTTSPEIVPQVITRDEELRKKTALAVIEPTDDGNFLLSLYRKSSRVEGQFSREIYRYKDGEWIRARKDSHKYLVPPFPPPGAEVFSIGDVNVWTLKKLSLEESEQLLERFHSYYRATGCRQGMASAMPPNGETSGAYGF